MKRTEAWRIGLAVLAAAALGADWPEFRGPKGCGTSAEKGLVENWSAKENVAWQCPLPGPGSSSPIVIGQKIFLTCYTGYGLNQDEPGDTAKLEQHLLCVNAADGKIEWKYSMPAKALDKPEEYRGFMALHGYASSTPVSDGAAVYAFFGRTGVIACDMTGKLLWKSEVGNRSHGWGSATSPLLTKNLVIVNGSVECDAVVAFDKATGKEAWRTEGGIPESWSTPALVDLPDGKQELVVSMKNKVKGFDPANGKLLWECDGIKDYVCPAVVAKDGIVYVSGGRTPATLAIRCGGRGDVTGSHIVWQVKKAAKVASPLVADGLVILADNKGAVICLNAADGSQLYQERLDFTGGGDKVYASPILADGKIYIVSRLGGAVTLAAGKEFRELARSDLGDKSVFNATPAVIAPGRLLIRSDKCLYCIGK